MSNTYTHSSQHPGPGYPPGPGAPVSGYPGQQQPGAGPRFPGYQPRGGAPQQNMRQPHYFQMNPQQATMMPQGQVYTFPQQGAVSMSYHIVGPTQQYQHTAAPAPGQQQAPNAGGPRRQNIFAALDHNSEVLSRSQVKSKAMNPINMSPLSWYWKGNPRNPGKEAS